MTFYLGLNLSHNSSVAVVDESGKLLIALQEERFTRRKNDYSFPYLSLSYLFEQGYLNAECLAVIIGSHSGPELYNIQYWENIFHPTDVRAWERNAFFSPPGHNSKAITSIADQKNFVMSELTLALKKFVNVPNIHFQSHEESHNASGYIGSGFESCLAISLDAAGDDESGIIQLFDRQSGVTELLRIPITNSLGEFYSEVTRRYGFKASRHEGKITGLAAFGKHSPAVPFLSELIRLVDGCPTFNFSSRPENFAQLRNFLKDSIENASQLTSNYADLAFAAQFVFEKTIVEMVDYWVKRTGMKSISLAGGVFANVKVNQAISEIPGVERVYIFPAMSDEGLAAGGVWNFLLSEKNCPGQPVGTMRLGSHLDKHHVKSKNVKEIKYDHIRILVETLSKLIRDGLIVGILEGREEFGPRALGARSIVFRPDLAKANIGVNKRLRRTEFMPFAPAVLAEEFHALFDCKSSYLNPFESMTMTVGVKADWIKRLDAVTHIDQTARPQIVLNDGSLLRKILEEFFRISGVPALANTSFNLHEEPIIQNVNSGIEALQLGAIDVLATDESLYFLQSIFEAGDLG